MLRTNGKHCTYLQISAQIYALQVIALFLVYLVLLSFMVFKNCRCIFGATGSDALICVFLKHWQSLFNSSRIRNLRAASNNVKSVAPVLAFL